MTPPTSEAATARTSMVRSLWRLARPHQWAKSVFVFIGPLYAMPVLAGHMSRAEILVRALFAAGAFALASSACYVVNDVLDAEQDRAHPRKKSRPIASGAVSTTQGASFAALLMAGALALLAFFPDSAARPWVALCAAIYVGNVVLYSALLKHIVISDVMSLALGFVLRVLGGCAAVGVAPSVWLLNCTFFLAMFLAFGKRLGERRTMGEKAHTARRVQSAYTDNLLEMAVVVTGVATLVGYTIYVAEQKSMELQGFNLLWLTVLPATYALFRSIVLLDRGQYDDPTELAVRDRPFQLASLLFALFTVTLMAWRVMHAKAGAG